jgi:sugar phosphate isomerase/epimerase
MKTTIMTRVFWRCYSTRSLEGSLVPIIKRVAESGYDAVDLCEWTTEFWPLGLTEEDKSRLRKLVGSLGLEVSSLTTPTASEVPERVTYLDRLKRSVEVAAYFDAKVIMCGIAPRDEESYRRTVELYREVGFFAEDYGIDLAIEFMNISFPTTDSILKFLKDVGSKNVGVCLEVENVNARPKEKPLMNHMKKVKGRIKLVHLVDPSNEELHRRMKINVAEVIKDVNILGFDGYLVNEAISGEVPCSELDGEAKKSSSFLKKIINSLHG